MSTNSIAEPIYFTNIERAFYQMVCNSRLELSDGSRDEYFFTYYAQKLVLFNHIYNNIQSELNYHTDHSQKHINQILNLYEKILINNIQFLNPEEQYHTTDEVFNFYEVYLLLCSTILHDIGNIRDRFDHESKIREVMSRLPLFIIDDDMKKYAIDIAKSHRGEGAISSNLPVDADYKGQVLNLRLIAAILRLADELEEGETRISSNLYEVNKDKMDDYSRLCWDVSICIKRITPIPENKIIEINCKLNKEELFREYNKDNKSIYFIDELIYRIDKINIERQYTMNFMTKPIYFSKIRLSLVVGNSAPILFMFSDEHGYLDFWEQHDKYDPRKKNTDYEMRKKIK